MVCLQADEDTINRLTNEFCNDGESQYQTFVDDDYPANFGWTAVAFKPMTREEGSKYFDGLRLA